MQLYLFSFLSLHYMFRLHAAIFRWFSSSTIQYEHPNQEREIGITKAAASVEKTV
jgi:hypothetical protein